LNSVDQIREWLFPWQTEWLDDQSKWKISLKARQIGWTEVISLEALLHALREDNHSCFLVSTKVKNARRQILNRIKARWLPALSLDDTLEPFVEGAEVYKNKIELPNGSQIIASANEAEKFRGNTDASYWMDELAFWPTRIHSELQDAIWPQIESKNNPDSVLRLVSTPWSVEDNLYAEIWKNIEGRHPQFSRHEWNIYDAVDKSDKFEFDIDAARSRYPRQKFEREYLCSFIEVGNTYFDRAELLELEQSCDVEGWDLYLGIDLAKVNDLTSIVPLYTNGDEYHVPKVWLMRSVEYGQQAEVIDRLIEQLQPEEVCVDVTVHQSFPDLLDANVDGKRGDRERKAKRTESLKQHVEQSAISFDWTTYMREESSGFVEEPTNALLDDLCKVQQSETPSGKVRYEAPRDDSGHADSYSALLLALEAKEGGAKYCFG